MLLTILNAVFWLFVITVVLSLVLDSTRRTAHKTIAKTSAPTHTLKAPVRKDPFDAVMKVYKFIGFIVLVVIGIMAFAFVYDWFTHL